MFGIGLTLISTLLLVYIVWRIGDLAMLTSMTSFRNHLIFGKLFFAVTPFQINFVCLADLTLSGIRSN
ncbi:MAG: hypothetical protein ACI8PB_000065 [Desulforhopalus sp.]|jgi:hypothetical protein